MTERSTTPLDAETIARLRQHFTGDRWQPWISNGIGALCDLATMQSETGRSVPVMSDEHLQELYAEKCAEEGHVAGLRAVLEIGWPR